VANQSEHQDILLKNAKRINVKRKRKKHQRFLDIENSVLENMDAGQDCMMERNYLICALTGWFSAKHESLEGTDLKIMIDQRLIESGFPTLGSEKGDAQLLLEMESELLMSVMGRKFNRKDRRKN